MKLVVLHLRKLRLVAGADHFGVVATGDFAHGGHDALVVHDHHVHGPGGENQLGHQVVAGHGDAPAHEQFVARAADPHQVDAGGPFFLCQPRSSGDTQAWETISETTGLWP
jgi:hypothetical protein